MGLSASSNPIAYIMFQSNLIHSLDYSWKVKQEQKAFDHLPIVPCFERKVGLELDFAQ